MNVIKKSVEIGGTTIEFETGKYAKQAGGAVVVTAGDSRVLVTTVAGSSEKSHLNFLPLTCVYQDRNGAYGTIPGSFFKREGRPNERETLISRMIDRPLRPLFPKHLRRELQIIATVMSYDIDHETDVLSMCGASAATHISDAPLDEPIGAVRVCEVDGDLVLNPGYEIYKDAKINLVFAGTADAITMVEGGCKEADEDRILDALELAHENIKKIVAVVEEMRAEVGKDKIEVPPAREPSDELTAKVEELGLGHVQEGMSIKGKHDRSAFLKEKRDEIIANLTEGLDEEEADETKADIKKVWKGLERKSMRGKVISDGTRIDGRETDEIRPIWTEIGVAPRAHGSAIFTRGETQAFATIALGTDRRDPQIIEVPTGKRDRYFMMTYSFPPFCTGEAYMLRGPKRREIGHGALARRALLPVIPDHDDWPYVMRSCVEVLESNGSSSMATVCSTSMAMMDAGVPVEKPVAGIAMGLIKEGDDFAVLSDILGDEDHLGDMDFKVTGTKDGITAFQMDTKLKGVSREVMKKAMEQAKQGRLHILGEMAKVISEPREEMSPHAPRITSISIDPDKIRDIIGPGGKTIRGIQEACDVNINVDDDGRVEISSDNQENTDKAMAMVREITQEAEIGALYVGVVKNIVDFGAFVEIFPGTDGLIHISHIAHERIDKVSDVLQTGDEVLVKVIDVDRGKVRLSRKEALDAQA